MSIRRAGIKIYTVLQVLIKFWPLLVALRKEMEQDEIKKLHGG